MSFGMFIHRFSRLETLLTIRFYLLIFCESFSGLFIDQVLMRFASHFLLVII